MIGIDARSCNKLEDSVEYLNARKQTNNVKRKKTVFPNLFDDYSRKCCGSG